MADYLENCTCAQKKSDLFCECDYRQNWMTSFVTNKTIITETKFEKNSKTLSRYLKSIFIDIINIM